MITSFRHGGLKRLFDRADKSGLRADQLRRIKDVLWRLDIARHATELNLPGYRLHALKGDLKGRWSITISENWRITFPL